MNHRVRNRISAGRCGYCCCGFGVPTFASPEGAKCDSPGQRPGKMPSLYSQALKGRYTMDRAMGWVCASGGAVSPLQGLGSSWGLNPGRCPGLSPCAPLGLGHADVFRGRYDRRVRLVRGMRHCFSLN